MLQSADSVEETRLYILRLQVGHLLKDLLLSQPCRKQL